MTTEDDADNPMFKKKPKKETYVQGELFPLEQESLLTRVKNWWGRFSIRPYFGVRDLNNGPDTLHENKPVTGYEIGIKIRF